MGKSKLPDEFDPHLSVFSQAFSILNPKSFFFSLLYHKGVTKNKHTPPSRPAGLSVMGPKKRWEAAGG
jgi:hypothetical protein